MKKIIIFLITTIIILLSIIIYLIYKNSFEKNLKFNTFYIGCNENQTKIIVKIENNTKNDYNTIKTKMILYLNNGKIETLPININELKKGETTFKEIYYNENICNYYKIEYIQ